MNLQERGDGEPPVQKGAEPHVKIPAGRCSQAVPPPTGGEGTGEPRFFLLSKDTMETFGFCLHEELGCQGHIIRQVELGGLAQRRGLQDGDRLLQVNGRFVDNMDHRRVNWGHPTAGETPDPPQPGTQEAPNPSVPWGPGPTGCVWRGDLSRAHSLGPFR